MISDYAKKIYDQERYDEVEADYMTIVKIGSKKL